MRRSQDDTYKNKKNNNEWHDLKKIAESMTEEQIEKFKKDTEEAGRELAEQLNASPFGVTNFLESMLDILEDRFDEDQLGTVAMAWLSLRFVDVIPMEDCSMFATQAASSLTKVVKAEWDKSDKASDRVNVLMNYLKSTERTVGKIMKDKGVKIDTY